MNTQTQTYELGMVGLGVMGRNLLLNMADHGHAVAGYDVDALKLKLLEGDAGERKVAGAATAESFMAMLRVPRAIMLLVPAGPPVDAVIHNLLSYLQPGDMLIDGGNSFFKDTDLRAKALADKGIHFLGVGVSGGEFGARHGPSLMIGGPAEAYQSVAGLFADVAAQVNGQPCAAYLGPGSAGHYVKMVHNGIEYGLMQLIAESYDLMKRGLGLSDDELAEVFARWDQGELKSFLIEITAHIFRQVDDRTGKRLVDLIVDEAHQKGTGTWTSQEALALGVPIPTIDMALAMRALSMAKGERRSAAQVLPGPAVRFDGDRAKLIERLGRGLYGAMVVTYAQGMQMLRVASETYHYGLKLEDVARIWRGGCIIRSTVLEPLRAAYQQAPNLLNPLLAPAVGSLVVERQDDLRAAVTAAAQYAIPAPALMSALAYFDALRSERLPANLIQAQRDYFGAHTYERVDVEGAFHTQWEH